MLTDQVGDVVYIRSAANGSYKVARCDPKNDLKMPGWGIIIAKWNYTSCLVQTYGEIKNIYTGLIPRRVYSISGDGRPKFPPDGPDPGGTFLHQNLGLATDVGVLFLNPSVDPTRRIA
jgi:hypothetical protein